jgi:hypothetical protein
MYIMSALSYGPAGREGSVSMAYGARKRKTGNPAVKLDSSSHVCEPAMKVFGSVALGSSSARKYLRTCESCFQKLRVSYEEHCVLDCHVLWSYIDMIPNACVPGIRHGFCR